MKNDEYFEIIEKEDTYKIVLKILTIIIVIGLCLFMIYKYIIINPKTVFKSGINKTFKIVNNFNKKLDVLNKPIAINGVATIDSNDQLFYDIDNYKFNLDFNIDSNNNKYSSFIDINYKNDSKAKILLQEEDYNTYLTLPGLYKSIINLNEIEYKNIKYNYLNDITNAIKDSINKQIDDRYLTTGNEEVLINDIKYNYEYIELSINKEEFSKLIGNSIADIKDDHRLFNSIKESIDMNEDELNNYLDDIQKIIITRSFDSLKLKYYTKGVFKNIIGMRLIIDDKDTITIFNDNRLYTTINYYEYKLDIHENDNKYYINVLNNDNKILYLIINNLKDNLIDIDYEYYDNKGIIYIDKNNNHGNFKLSIVNDKTYSINYDYEIIKGEEVANINKDNVIELKKLKEDDYLDIYNYYNNNFDNIIKDVLTSLTEKLLNY